MLILTATNVTLDVLESGHCNPVLARPDGTSDYDVCVGINQHMIWRGLVRRRRRDAGAAELLRLVAKRMDESGVTYSKVTKEPLAKPARKW